MADSDNVFFGALEPGRYEGRVTYIDPATQLPLTKPLVEQSPTQQSSFIEIDFGTVVRITLQIQLGPAAVPVPPPVVTLNTPQEVTSARRNELLEIPNANRDITPLLQVVPGAIPIGPAALGKVIIDGKGKDQQTLKIDGLDATPMVELPAGDSAVGVLEKLQTQSVMSILSAGTKNGAFDPIYGPGTGSVSDSVVQGGSSVPKFDIYHVLSNDALNARNFFDYDGKNAIRRSLFGGTFGGTIQPGNASFFLSYEGIRGRTERNIYEAIPVDALCRCSAGPAAPFINGFLPNGTDVLPGASLNSDYLIAKRRGRIESESNAFNFRIEFKPFANTGSTPTSAAESKQWHDDTFTLRFTRQSGEAFVPDGVTGRLQRQDLLFINALAKAKLSRGDYEHTIKFGVNRTRGKIAVENPPSFGQNLAQSLVTISGSVNTAGLPEGLLSVPVATLGGLVKGVGRGFDLDPTSYIGAYDGVRQFKNGQHKLSFGVETRFIHLDFDRLGGLTYNFSNLTGLRAGAPSTITFLSDLSGPSPFTNGQGRRRARQEYYLGYLQMVSELSYRPDQKPRVTLTYGFRYDYFGPVRERDDRAVVVDPLTGDFLPMGTDFYRAKKNNFQPRFGVAYLLPFDSALFENTTLRGNVGIYSGVPRIGDLLLPIESDRLSTGRSGGAFPIDPRDITDDFLDNPLARQFQPLTFSRDFSTPERVYKWDASLTRTFRVIYDFRVGYSGNIGRNLPLANIGNPIISVETNPNPSEPAVIIRQLDLVQKGDIFKPFGEFFFRTSRGRSSYNAMTISLTRNSDTKTSPVPLPSWLQLKRLTVQYTLSRNLGNASGALASDPSNFDSDYGYNAADARHVFKLQATYQTSTAFKVGNWSPLGGWTISPTINARSGLPLIVRIDRPDVVYVDESGNVFAKPAAGRRAVINTPGGGATGGARVPDLLPGVNPYIRNGLELLNPAAFAIPKPGQFGNLRRGELRGPRSFQLDLALSRQVLDAEKTRNISAEFKVEIFNVFNRANFTNPTASLPNTLPADTLANQIQPGMPFTRAKAGSFGIINAADPGRQIQFSLSFRLNEGKK
jgi:hypothetical protein